MISAGENFLVRFEGFNIERKSGTEDNHHDEKNVVGICEEDSGFNDIFIMKDEQTVSGAKLTITVKSEVNIDLWRNGILTFHWDEKTQEVTIPDAAIEGRAKPWVYCNPQAAVDLVIEGLKCLSGQTEGVENEAKQIANLWIQRLSHIDFTKFPNRYNAPDCQAEPKGCEDDMAGCISF